MFGLVFRRLVACYRANRQLSRIIRDADKRFSPYARCADDYQRYIVERAFWEVR